MFCNHCGAPNPDDAAFCGTCGKPILRKVHSTAQQPELSAPSAGNSQGPGSVNEIPPHELKESEIQGFASTYARMADHELLALSKDVASLKEAAREALAAETCKRQIEIEPQKPPAGPESESHEKYRGVGGWLALFVFALIVGGPIMTIINVAGEFEEFGVVFITVADAVISAALAGLGIYAGISLLRLKPNAVRIAKRYLIAYGIYTMVLLIMVVIAASGDAQPSVETAGPVIRSFGFVIIWYQYLEKSKRIAITFPHS